jgi:ribose transport system substrate-binding protein
MVSEDTGKQGADLLVEAMGAGKKTVAVLNGRPGADNLERRAKAFEERLASKYPDVSIVTTVSCQETAESCGQAIEDDIIEQYPDLDGLFVVGLWGLLDACSCSESGLTCVCEETQMPKWKSAAKGKLKTVSYDTLPFQLELMQQGYVSALIGQKYFGWGYDSVLLMYEHITHDQDIASFVDSGFDVVCPNNVDDMASKWKAADFTEALAPACKL